MPARRRFHGAGILTGGARFSGCANEHVGRLSPPGSAQQRPSRRRPAGTLPGSAAPERCCSVFPENHHPTPPVCTGRAACLGAPSPSSPVPPGSGPSAPSCDRGSAHPEFQRSSREPHILTTAESVRGAAWCGCSAVCGWRRRGLLAVSCAPARGTRSDARTVNTAAPVGRGCGVLGLQLVRRLPSGRFFGPPAAKSAPVTDKRTSTRGGPPATLPSHRAIRDPSAISPYFRRGLA